MERKNEKDGEKELRLQSRQNLNHTQVAVLLLTVLLNITRFIQFNVEIDMDVKAKLSNCPALARTMAIPHTAGGGQWGWAPVKCFIRVVKRRHDHSRLYIYCLCGSFECVPVQNITTHRWLARRAQC